MPLPMHSRSGRTPALLAGEERAGAPEAGGHLVGDQQHVVLRQPSATAATSLRGRRRRMPAAPCTSGSTTTAASSVARGLGDQRDGGVERPGLVEAGARSTGNRSGSNTSVPNRRRRPTATRWCRRGRRRRRRGSWCVRSTPWFVQYWKAIFSACSTAAAPSEANRKWGSSTGTDGGERLGQLDDDPVAVAEQRGVGDPVELVADRPASSSGTRWPSVVTHSEEMASR